MKTVLIFAKTPYSKTPYDQWLKPIGVTPVILTTDEFFGGYSHLPNVFGFSNYDRNPGVFEKAMALARKFTPIGVFARAEADVLRAAQVREQLGIQGQKVSSALAFRDKVIMKDLVATSRVRTPIYQRLNSLSQVFEFIEKHQYPVVIKPVAEAGSTGVHVIRNSEELKKLLPSLYLNGMEIETFVEGPMYHVDGLIQNGKLVFIHPFQYLNDCLAYRSSKHSGTFTLSPSNPHFHDLVTAAKRVINALPTPLNTAFHAEFWITPSKEIVLCEIASRTGGGMISSNIEYSFGFNIDKEWLYAECGLARPLNVNEFKFGGGLLIPPQVGTLTHIPTESHLPYVHQKQISGAVGQRFNGGVKSGLFLAGYVVSGSNEEEVASHMSATANWFQKGARWSA